MADATGGADRGASHLVYKHALVLFVERVSGSAVRSPLDRQADGLGRRLGYPQLLKGVGDRMREGRAGGRAGGQAGGQVGGRAVRQTNGQMALCILKRTDGRSDGRTNGNLGILNPRKMSNTMNEWRNGHRRTAERPGGRAD